MESEENGSSENEEEADDSAVEEDDGISNDQGDVPLPSRRAREASEETRNKKRRLSLNNKQLS